MSNFKKFDIVLRTRRTVNGCYMGQIYFVKHVYRHAIALVGIDTGEEMFMSRLFKKIDIPGEL